MGEMTRQASKSMGDDDHTIVSFSSFAIFIFCILCCLVYVVLDVLVFLLQVWIFVAFIFYGHIL